MVKVRNSFILRLPPHDCAHESVAQDDGSSRDDVLPSLRGESKRGVIWRVGGQHCDAGAGVGSWLKPYVCFVFR